MAEPWTVELFRDQRGRSPIEDFLKKQSPVDRKKVERKLRILRDRTVDERPETIYESRTILLLEADRKKDGDVSKPAITRAKENLDEWESR